MNDDGPKRRFFSGSSLRQALVLAASHFDIPPEEVAYTPIEKRHGFLRTARKVMIEVDPDHPRRAAGVPAVAAPATAEADGNVAPPEGRSAPERREPFGHGPERRPELREAGGGAPRGGRPPGERGGRGEHGGRREGGWEPKEPRRAPG
ncbi:MAG TPA: hypothetical protein VGC93_10630, partial [Thermoanaerobaculia bacterium]